MGLDMFLERMPRYEDATASDVMAVANYLDWQKSKAEGSEYANCSFKEWCGVDEIPSKEYIDFYSTFYKDQYSGWDADIPWLRTHEEVGYWRKANAIHNWFVENVQDGVDDCCYHREVTAEDLCDLLDVCMEVLNSCEVVDGKIADASTAERLPPSTSGFFFGSTEYDEYYVQDIEHTIDVITEVLETTDFDTQMIYYVSSW